ncbi:MAG: hypothetical protein AAF481_03405 [Acidobacteriota bacterium]
MHRSLSWIDPKDLSAALVRAGVRRTPRNQRRSVNVGLSRLEAEQDGTVAEFPSADGPSHRARPVAVEAIAEPPRAVPFEVPSGTLQDRLMAFVRWVEQITECRQVFVADAEGLVLIEHQTAGELVAVSSSFMSSLERVRACLGTEPRGVLAVDIDDQQVLQLIQIRSDLGRFHLGCIVTDPLGRSQVNALREGLATIFELEEAVLAFEDPE